MNSLPIFFFLKNKKGWFITYIDKDPEVLKRQELLAKMDKATKDESDRQTQVVANMVRVTTPPPLTHFIFGAKLETTALYSILCQLTCVVCCTADNELLASHSSGRTRTSSGAGAWRCAGSRSNRVAAHGRDSADYVCSQNHRRRCLCWRCWRCCRRGRGRRVVRVQTTVESSRLQFQRRQQPRHCWRWGRET